MPIATCLPPRADGGAPRDYRAYLHCIIILEPFVFCDQVVTADDQMSLRTKI
jgi:hypothetical protein